MEFVEISIDDFPSSDINIDDVSNPVFRQLIVLSLNYNDKIVLVDGDVSNVLQKVRSEDINVFTNFGVYFKCFSKEFDEVKKSTLSIVDGSRWQSAGDISYTVSASSYVYFNINQEKFNEFVGTIVAGVGKAVAVNDSIIEWIARKKEDDFVNAYSNSHSNSFNVAELIEQYEPNPLRYLDAFESAIELLRQIEDIPKDKSLYFSSKNNDRYTQDEIMYLKIAAYLTLKDNRVCVIPDSRRAEFTRYMMDFSSNEYNYANDYFNYLADTPNFGLLNKNGAKCLLVKDEKAAVSNKECRIGADVIEFKYNDKYNSVSVTTTTPVTVWRDSINMLSLTDVFGIGSTDWSTACNEYDKLNSVLAKMDEVITEKCSIARYRAVNVTNVLCYRKDGITHFGYVVRWLGEIPYIMFPIADKNYDSVPITFNSTSVHEIIGIEQAEDGIAIAERFVEKGYSSGIKGSVLMPKHARGFLMHCIAPKRVQVTEDFGFTFEEVGFWSAQTRVARTSSLNTLLKYCTNKGLWKSGFLSCFGGPHPAKKTSLDISPEMRRYDA